MERLQIDARSTIVRSRQPVKSRSGGSAANDVSLLQRRAGNRAIAKALAIQRTRWWLLDPANRSREERDILLAGNKGYDELRMPPRSDGITPAFLEAISWLGAGDIVTIQAHGGTDGKIVWDGRTLTAAMFAKRLITALDNSNKPRNIAFTLDVFACYSAGDVARWESWPNPWEGTFVHSVACLLNGSKYSDVTVRGYVGMTKVSLYDKTLRKHAGLSSGAGGSVPDEPLPRARRSRPEPADPSAAWSLQVRSGDLSVTWGSELQRILAARQERPPRKRERSTGD